MALSWAEQAYQGSLPAQTATYRSYLRMRALGDCDANGASNGSGINSSLGKDGYTTLRQASGANWLAFARARFTEPAVVIAELSRGQALRDEITGQPMDATNLQYHWHTWLDYHPGGWSARAGRTLPAGLWVADGDNGATNPIINGRRTRVVAGHSLQFYTVSTIANSAPVDLIAVYPKVSFAQGGGTGMGIPNGWKDDGATLTAPNGVVVVKGFRAHILSNPWLEYNWPLRPEFTSQSIEPGNPSIGAGSRQDFRLGSLGWTTTKGVYAIWLGQDLLALQTQNTALQVTLAKVRADLG
jgi:hypothetical protein